jgi:hypothetical protein
MYQSHHDELVRKNLDTRARMQNSLTYSMANGLFVKAKQIIEEQRCDVDETDTWWVHMRAQKRDRIHVTARTPLIYCILIADDQIAYSIAQQLVENNASLSPVDSNGCNALMYAAMHERTGLLKFLVNLVDVDDLLCADKYGNTAMHLASLGKCQANCHLLNKVAFRKFNVESNGARLKNIYGHTPLDLCKFSNHHECVKMQFNFNRHHPSLSLLNQSDQEQATITNLPSTTTHANTSYTDYYNYLLENNKNTTSVTSILMYEESIALDESRFDLFEILNNRQKTANYFTSRTTTGVLQNQSEISIADLLCPDASWLQTYSKYLNSIKDSQLIRDRLTNKKFTVDRKNMTEIVESTGSEYEIVRSIAHLPLTRSLPTNVSQTRKRSILKKLDLDEDSCLTWREQINKLFETLELEKSKSFRKPFVKKSIQQLPPNSAESGAGHSSVTGYQSCHSIDGRRSCGGNLTHSSCNLNHNLNHNGKVSANGTNSKQNSFLANSSSLEKKVTTGQMTDRSNMTAKQHTNRRNSTIEAKN